jgi:GGDEF domain-containing protein
LVEAPSDSLAEASDGEGAILESVSISASVGTALYPDDGATASELLASADKSMYARKRGTSVA